MTVLGICNDGSWIITLRITGSVLLITDHGVGSTDHSDSCIAPFCSTKVVFSRVPKEDLTELVSSPVEEYGQILDIDTDGIRPISDSDVKAFLLKSKGIANPLIIQSSEKTRRNEMLISALSFGAGIRQLSRLTGVSFGVIQKLQK